MDTKLFLQQCAEQHPYYKIIDIVHTGVFNCINYFASEDDDEYAQFFKNMDYELCFAVALRREGEQLYNCLVQIKGDDKIYIITPAWFQFLKKII